MTECLSSPVSVQKQLIEIVSRISSWDSSIHKWDKLMDFLITQLKNDDIRIVNIALEIANRLFKRYRFEFLSERLVEEITYVVDHFTQPLTEKVMSTMFFLNAHQHDEATLMNIYKAAILMVKIFHSLSNHDLPRNFSVNLGLWMDAFHEMICIDLPDVCNYLQESLILTYC